MILNLGSGQQLCQVTQDIKTDSTSHVTPLLTWLHFSRDPISDVRTAVESTSFAPGVHLKGRVVRRLMLSVLSTKLLWVLDNYLVFFGIFYIFHYLIMDSNI